MKNKFKKQKGQALILIALGIIGLVGITALAIDGGNAFSQRRHAQNAADTAALAGAQELIRSYDGSSGHSWDSAAKQIASENGYTNNPPLMTVTVHYPPIAGCNGAIPILKDNPTDLVENPNYYVQVIINQEVPTYFASVIGISSTHSCVDAIAKAEPLPPGLAGNSIIVMGNCPSLSIDISGAGNSGGVEAINGGIFINASDDNNGCALNPGNSAGAIGIRATGGCATCVITSVGSYNYAGDPLIDPVTTGFNGGVQIGDPLAYIPEPQCTGNGSLTGTTYHPGNFDGSALGGGLYSPGIYCITGDVILSGQQLLYGQGIVLYFINGGLRFTGNSAIQISAPTSDNCFPENGDPTASCTYRGIAIFSARDNTSIIEIRGNGGNAVTGTIYALSGIVQGKGGGVDPNDTDVIGQIICKELIGTGNGSFKVDYYMGDYGNVLGITNLTK